jgi:thiosulfate dehydrogenase
MANRSPARRSSKSTPKRSGGSFLAFLSGIAFALAVGLAGWWFYMQHGKQPLAVHEAAVPIARRLEGAPQAKSVHEVQQPPFGISEDVFEAGAKVYVSHCSSCHGTPGHDSPLAQAMHPAVSQLWKKHGQMVGVSGDAAGETFGKIKNGIRQTVMPSYQRILTPTQMWQVTLLLKNADQSLPDPVAKILSSHQ